MKALGPFPVYHYPCNNNEDCKLFTCERNEQCSYYAINKITRLRWVYRFQTIEKPIMDKKINEQLVFIKILFALVVISFILILALAIALVTKK
jgi:hypothetical protein